MADKAGGALFPNTSTGNAPDYKGTLELDEALVEYINDKFSKREEIKLELAGWKRKARNSGKPYIGLLPAVPWNERQTTGPKRRAKPRPKAEFDDEIPF